MQWQDDAFILRVAPYGERYQILHVLTRDRGLWTALGPLSKRKRLEPGCAVRGRWKARLENQLGFFSHEPLEGISGTLYLGAQSNPSPLNHTIHREARIFLVVLHICELCIRMLPERQAYPGVYRLFHIFLQLLSRSHWGVAVLYFELHLLRYLGYGLELGYCAVTGMIEGLCYVSPNSGKAVTQKVGRPYHKRLLYLPDFMGCLNGMSEESVLGHIKGLPDIPNHALVKGFELTGYFLNRHQLKASEVFTLRSHLVRALGRHRNASLCAQP